MSLADSGLTERSRIPTTGMRGGLGRTLLTAFLVLAILPLSVITWYVTRRERSDIQREVTAKLSTTSTIMETQVVYQWIEHRTGALALLATLPATQESTGILVAADTDHLGSVSDLMPSDASTAHDVLQAQLQTLLAQDPAFHRLAVLDKKNQVIVSADAPDFLTSSTTSLVSEQSICLQSITLDYTGNTNLVISQRITASNNKNETLAVLTGWLNPCGLIPMMRAASELNTIGEIYLVDANGFALSQGQWVTSPGIEAALAGNNTEMLDNNYDDTPVIGVYRWMSKLGLALVAEQSQEEAFTPADNVTAAIVGATLGVALITAVIAAFVTRQITRPIVQLTESALYIAEGDMQQYVPVKSRDEIGILAYVFNRMAADLKALYDDLEGKVAQRTAMLQKANYQIQRRAIQFATTVEVSQAATSILEPNLLLRKVARVVHDSFFSYSYVGIYLLDDSGKWALLKESTGGSKELAAVRAKPMAVENGSAVGQAVRTGDPQIVRCDAERAQQVFLSPYVRTEAAVPLKMGDQIIGVLDIMSTEEDDFDADDISVLQTVANQITIALENARTYITEREAAIRLRELNRSKRRFLVNMSHELRTPLTNIIGFSRLMLKGISGPLTEQQENDTQIIFHNGQHLLGLINDLLDISHIEAGMMELEFREVNLTDLINSVMATASALVRDKEIELYQDVTPDLPALQADGARIRQVLLRLLANAAKFTEEGSITVQAQLSDGYVLVSVSDTGVGISPDDFGRIFQQFEQGHLENGRRPDGAGLGLALSKEFVEMHGGHIWVESTVGEGATFTFSLPLKHRAQNENEKST
ncbi:MAG: GAF domain-containing protein [Chloroflexi bacterium]|nr:GAF domain-containing protein [Chloroflexota bacterium]